MVNKELEHQEERDQNRRQAEYENRVKKEQRDRKRINTSKTIFGNEKNSTMYVERNASEKQKEEYKRHFANLQIFL